MVVSRAKKGTGGGERGAEKRKARWSVSPFSRLARYTRKNSAAKVKGERETFATRIWITPASQARFFCLRDVRPPKNHRARELSIFFLFPPPIHLSLILPKRSRDRVLQPVAIKTRLTTFFCPFLDIIVFFFLRDISKYRNILIRIRDFWRDKDKLET